MMPILTPNFKFEKFENVTNEESSPNHKEGKKTAAKANQTRKSSMRPDCNQVQNVKIAKNMKNMKENCIKMMKINKENNIPGYLTTNDKKTTLLPPCEPDTVYESIAKNKVVPPMSKGDTIYESIFKKKNANQASENVFRVADSLTMHEIEDFPLEKVSSISDQFSDLPARTKTSKKLKNENNSYLLKFKFTKFTICGIFCGISLLIGIILVICMKYVLHKF